MISAEYVIKPASAKALKQWNKALEQEPDLMAKEKERLENRPLERGDNPSRTHKLRGTLSTRKIDGVNYDQWQHEISSAGRVWYCVDRKSRIAWITFVSLSHPKET